MRSLCGVSARAAKAAHAAQWTACVPLACAGLLHGSVQAHANDDAGGPAAGLRCWVGRVYKLVGAQWALGRQDTLHPCQLTSQCSCSLGNASINHASMHHSQLPNPTAAVPPPAVPQRIVVVNRSAAQEDKPERLHDSFSAVDYSNSR